MNTIIKCKEHLKRQKHEKRMMYQKIEKVAFMLLFAFMFVAGAFAQSSAYSGKEFLVAFGNNDKHQDLRYQHQTVWDTVQLILRVTAIEQAKVSIKFNDNASLNDEIFLSANEIYDYKLSYSQANASYSGLAGSHNMKSIAVFSTGKISLIALNTADRSTEATLVMPVENLGTDYIHTSLGVSTGHLNGFLIIATEENTVVNFGGSNAPATCTLAKKGEVYPYYYDGVMWGMTIKANKPIAYFVNGTKGRLNAPSGSNYRENFAFEQLAPTNQWGTHFIVPTVLTEAYDREAIYARIYSRESTNNIKITYTDGKTVTYPSTQRWGEVTINIDEHKTAKAAYIQAESPISVCLFHSPHSFLGGAPAGDASQPSVAWLPPVEQLIGSALISPLDVSGKHVFLEMKHDFIVITPTATKNNTTISIDGGPPQNISASSKFSWVSDNVAGSGYAFGRYQFGSHAPLHDIFLHTTALVENPAGILLLAYGQGSYTSYFYTVGAAARNLDMSGYINGIHFDDVKGQTFCGMVYEITATSNQPSAQTSSYPKWHIDGKEDTNLRGKGLVGHSSEEMILQILEPGKQHTIKMYFLDASGQEQFCETTFKIGGVPVIKSFTLPGYCSNGSFNPDPPKVTDAVVISSGWQMETGVGTGIYNNINVPYRVSESDFGKRVRYYAESGCGKTYSDTQTIVVTSGVTPSVKISIKN